MPQRLEHALNAVAVTLGLCAVAGALFFGILFGWAFYTTDGIAGFLFMCTIAAVIGGAYGLFYGLPLAPLAAVVGALWPLPREDEGWSPAAGIPRALKARLRSIRPSTRGRRRP